jgi:hypothetical protein
LPADTPTRRKGKERLFPCRRRASHVGDQMGASTELPDAGSGMRQHFVRVRSRNPGGFRYHRAGFFPSRAKHDLPPRLHRHGLAVMPFGGTAVRTTPHPERRVEDPPYFQQRETPKGIRPCRGQSRSGSGQAIVRPRVPLTEDLGLPNQPPCPTWRQA